MTVDESQKMYSLLEELLNKKGLTVYKLCKGTGLSSAFFANWKRGLFSPRMEKVQLISDFLDVPINYFYDSCDDEDIEDFVKTKLAKELIKLFYDLPTPMQEEYKRRMTADIEFYKSLVPKMSN